MVQQLAADHYQTAAGTPTAQYSAFRGAVRLVLRHCFYTSGGGIRIGVYRSGLDRCPGNPVTERTDHPSAGYCHWFWCAGGVSDFAPGPGGYQSRCAGCSRQRFLLCPVTHPDKKACPGRHPADHPFLYDNHSAASWVGDLDL